jgi:hypothetical protein
VSWFWGLERIWSLECVLEWILLNVKFRKLGWLEWRWLRVFIATTTILAVVVYGAPDSPVVHRTWHYLVSGACHVIGPLGFGAVDHWNPLSCSCTKQSGGTPDMSGAFWLSALTSPLAHRTVWWIIAERPLEKNESEQFAWCSAWCSVHTGHCPVRHWQHHFKSLLQIYLSPWKGNRVKPFPKWFWWLKCPTQIIGLTSLL